jgi:hypothetical protein
MKPLAPMLLLTMLLASGCCFAQGKVASGVPVTADEGMPAYSRAGHVDTTLITDVVEWIHAH